MTVPYDYSTIEQSMGAGIVEAVLVIAMLLFIVWNIKLAMEDPDKKKK